MKNMSENMFLVGGIRRYWMILAIQLSNTSRGCHISSMCGFLRLLLPDQPSETGRLARDFATTYSDIDRGGGAAFFSASHSEVSVFQNIVTGYKAMI